MQTDHDEIARELKEHPAKKGLVFNIAVTALEIGGAIGLFHLAKSMGGSDVAAYLIGSIAPVLGALVIGIRSRKFSGASAAIFAFTALSAVVAVVGSTDPRVLLYKDCATTALIGLVFGLSCLLLPRPVMFYFSQRYGTDGHERRNGGIRQDVGGLSGLSRCSRPCSELSPPNARRRSA